MIGNRAEHSLVLLVGGMSGTGKTTASAEIGQQLGIPWLMVDDVRLALQRSRVQLPERTEELYFFADIAEKPDLWRSPPEVLHDALIATAEVLSPALEAIIENHVDQGQSIIIEGDSIVPSLFARQSVRQRNNDRQIRAVFLVEPDEDEVLANIRKRARSTTGMSDNALRTEARAKWLFGQWLIEEAHRYHCPLLQPRPWETLPARIMASLD